MNANDMKTTSAKRGGSDLERVMNAWMEYADTLSVELLTEQDERGRQVCFAVSQYARGRAEGLRQALRILAGEEA
jgi:hypothetical protein